MDEDRITTELVKDDGERALGDLETSDHETKENQEAAARFAPNCWSAWLPAFFLATESAYWTVSEQASKAPCWIRVSGGLRWPSFRNPRHREK